MKTVPLRGKKAAGRVALVDDDDYDLVSPYAWYVYEYKPKEERRVAGPYAIAPVRKGGKRTTVRMHMLITGCPLVDHEDHNGLNNQRANLRPATNGQNSHNTRPHANSLSRYKGVSWNNDIHSWIAQICIDGHQRRLGRYLLEAEAAQAYDAEALEAWGEYAYLNFPEKAPGQCGPDAAKL